MRRALGHRGNAERRGHGGGSARAIAAGVPVPAGEQPGVQQVRWQSSQVAARPVPPPALAPQPPSPPGAPIPACRGQGLRGPLGHALQGQSGLGPRVWGLRQPFPPPPRSPARPQRSFRLGWSPGPVEPARGRRRREAETSPPLCPLLSAFLSPALLEVASRIPQEWVGRENHSPGLGGEDQRVPGRGLSPRWGLALGTLGSRCRGNNRWSD